jgi:hypothetical protein
MSAVGVVKPYGNACWTHATGPRHDESQQCLTAFAVVFRGEESSRYGTRFMNRGLY